MGLTADQTWLKRESVFLFVGKSTLKHREKTDWKIMEGEKKCIRDISDTVKSFNLLTMEGSIMQREKTGQKLYLNESLP